jgi:hypothetical protein
MTFMCLAVLVLLFGGMFLFVKQKLAMMEARLNLLSETISTMAGITMNSMEHSEPDSEKSEHLESDSDSDSDSEHSESVYETESNSEIEIEEYKVPDLVNVEPITRVDENVIVEPIKIIVSDDDVTVKQIVVDTSYESLTVKELKEKISELNGPKLKTKKEMIEYLKNKI